MKDIDDLLSKHTPKPKRTLDNNFTNNIVSEIQSRPVPSLWQRLLSVLHSRLFSKVGIASMASIVLISGAAVAIALWPQPSVTPTVTKQLPSGNHIVGYDEQNCNYFGQLNGEVVRPTSDKVYFEIRSGAPFTDQQFKNTLQALCEDNLSNGAISYLIKRLPTRNTDGIESTDFYVIKSITPKSITISPDPHLDAKMYTTKPNLTYTHFSGQLLTYDQNTKVSYDSFKAGDTIKLIVQDTSGKSTETPTNYNPLNYPNNITILAILKTPPLTGDFSSFYTDVGKYIVRVEPCQSSPSGFCRQYDFAN